MKEMSNKEMSLMFLKWYYNYVYFTYYDMIDDHDFLWGKFIKEITEDFDRYEKETK